MSYQRSGRPPPKDGSYGGGGYNSAPSKSRGYPYVPGFYTGPQGYPGEPRPGFPIAGAQSPNVQSQGVPQPPRSFWSVDAVPVPTGVEKDKGNSYAGNVGDRVAVGNRSLPPIAQSYDHRLLHQHGGGTHSQASVDSSSSSHSGAGDKKSQTTDEADHKHQRGYSKRSEKKQSGSSHNEWTSSHDGDPHEDPANSRDAHTSSRDIHANGDKTSFTDSHSRDRDGKKNFRLNLDVLLQDEQLTNLLFAGISKATTKLEQSLKTTDKKMENYASTDDSTSRHKAQQSFQTSSAEGHQKLKSTVKRKTRKERVGVESKVKTESQASSDSFSKLSVLEKTLHLLCGKTNVEDVVRGSEKGSRGSKKPYFKPVGALSQLESYNDSGDDNDHTEKDTKKQTKTKKNAPGTQPFWSKMDQLSQQTGQSPNLASFSQAKKAGDNNEEELDSTVQNILQSIGFNFDLSKRPQELARQKEQQDVLHTSMINQSASFLGQSNGLVKGARAAVFSDKQKKAQPDSLNKETRASMQKRPDYERSASGDTFSAETQSGKNSYSRKGKNLDPDNDRSRMGLGSHEFRSDRHLENLQNIDWEQISPDEDEIDEIESRQIEKMKTLPHEKHAEVRQWSFSKERNAALSPHDAVLLDEAWKSKDLLLGSHETSLRLSERFRDKPKDEYIYQDVSKSIEAAALLAPLCSKQKEVSSSGSKSLKLPLQSGSAQVENLRVTSRTVHSDDNKNDEPCIESRKMSLPSKSDVRIVSQSPVFRKSQSPEMKVPRKRPASPLPCPVSKEKEDRVLNEKRSFSVLQAFLKTSFEKNAPGFCQALGLNMVSCDKLPLLQTLLGGLNVGGLPAAESTRSPVMSDHFDRDSVRKSPDRPTLISADIQTSRLPGMSRSPERHKAGLPDVLMSWVPGWQKSRSPDKQKSVSPDPDKRESMSLDRHLSRSPERRSSRLPDKMKSKSPNRQMSRSPVRRKSRLPGRSVSKSPDRRKSLSPSRSRSRSPSRSRSRSPDRSRSRSQDRHRSRSSDRHMSGSPDRHGSKSPDRHMSGSPDRHMSGSPDRHMSGSPDRHGSKSPDRHMSGSPDRHISGSSDRHMSGSPDRHGSKSPDRHMSGSPDRHMSGSPDTRSSRSPDSHRSRSPDRRGSRSPDRRRSRSPHRRRSRSPNKRGSRSSKRPRARPVKHGKSRLPHRLKTKEPIHIGAIQTWTQRGNEEADAMISNPLPGKLRTAQGQDTTLRPCYKKLQRSTDPPNQGQYYMKNRLLYRRAGRGDNLYGQLVVPKDYRPQILRMGHTILFSGHMGIGVMLQRISCHYYWPGMTGDVRRYVKSCPECRRVSPKHWTAPVVLGSMPIMNSLFERVAIDIVGPLPRTRKRNMYILTVVDCFSMWGEAIPLATIDSKRVAEALIEAFTRLGFPNHILTDNWSQFCGKLMEEVFQIFHTNHIHTIPYHPQVNGQVERFNGMLMVMFRKLAQEKPDRWDEYIPAVLFTYREVPHGSTGLPPATLLFGRPIKGPLEAMLRSWTDEGTSKEVISSYKYVEELKEKLHTGWALVTQNLRKARKRHAAYFYGKSRERSLQVGDKVLLLLPTGNNKLEIGWQGPFPVERVVSRTNYEIQIRGKLKIFHINLLRKYEERTGEESSHLMAMAVAMETDGT